MQQRFEEFVKNQHLIGLHQQILLAVSGGIDSIVMMRLFQESEFAYGVAHMNFGLRGTDSDADADFVGEFCEKYGISFFTKKVDTIAYAETHGLSTQMAARELRYAWFGELLETKNFAKIATAHHLNDSLETVLLHLSKGTGIAGLAGIPVKSGVVIRPLSFAAREEIENYAKAQKLAWREDASNQSSKYQRNFIRHQVIPSLKKINPNLESTFLNTLERLRDAQTLLTEALESFKNTQLICSEDGSHFKLSIEALSQTSTPLLYLDYILKEMGFGYAQVKQIWSVHAGEAGKTFSSPDFRVSKDREQYLFQKISKDKTNTYWIEKGQETLEMPGCRLRFEVLERKTGFKIPQDKHITALDADKLRFPLELRIWQQGDYFYPLGMQGKKKVSDFLIDLKVPLILKEKVWVLLSQQDIVGLLGHRPDERYKITEATQSIFFVEKQALSSPPDSVND